MINMTKIMTDLTRADHRSTDAFAQCAAQHIPSMAKEIARLTAERDAAVAALAAKEAQPCQP